MSLKLTNTVARLQKLKQQVCEPRKNVCQSMRGWRCDENWNWRNTNRKRCASVLGVICNATTGR